MTNIAKADTYTTRVSPALISGGITAVPFRDILPHLNVSPKDAANLELYHRASEKSGGKVIMDQEYGYLPVLIGRDNELIPLYKFVEVIDEITDYNRIEQEFPTLSFGQIMSAISFLRNMAQFNTRNIDIDELEDKPFAEDPDFQAAIRASLEDQEGMRVRTLE